MDPRITPADPSRISFADIPGELRNEIYSYITPVNGYMHEYQGFVLSCKLVHREVSFVALESYVKHLEQVESEACEPGNYPGVIILMPAFLSNMASVEVQFPIRGLEGRHRRERTYLLAGQVEPRLFRSLNDLLGMHLKKLVIGMYGPPGDDWFPDGRFSMVKKAFPYQLLKYLGATHSENQNVDLSTVQEVVWNLDFLFDGGRDPITKRFQVPDLRLFDWNSSIFRAIEEGQFHSKRAPWDCLVTLQRYHTRFPTNRSRSRGSVAVPQQIERPAAEISLRDEREFRVKKITWSRRICLVEEE